MCRPASSAVFFGQRRWADFLEAAEVLDRRLQRVVDVLVPEIELALLGIHL
jgi:hypothetical protein